MRTERASQFLMDFSESERENILDTLLFDKVVTLARNYAEKQFSYLAEEEISAFCKNTASEFLKRKNDDESFQKTFLFARDAAEEKIDFFNISYERE